MDSTERLGSHDPDERPDKRLGERLVEADYLRRDQVDRVLEEQARRPGTPFGQICLELGYLTPGELDHVLTEWGMRMPIGDVLVREGHVDPEQLQRALVVQKRRGGEIGHILVRLGAITERELYEVLARQYHLPLLRLGALVADPTLRTIINPAYAAQNFLVPAFKFERTLTIALSDPSKIGCAEELRRATGFEIVPAVALASEVRAFYRELYDSEPPEERGIKYKSAPPYRERHRGGGDESPPGDGSTALRNRTGTVAPEDLSSSPPNDVDLEIVDEEESDFRRSQYLVEVKDSPVVQNLVHAIISRALAMGASDIHLEADVSGPRLRFRVDGFLSERPIGGNQDELFRINYRSIISRLKILSRMDISEKRRPQDASFRMVTRRGNSVATVDFRLATMPGRFGEGMVIRLLDEFKTPNSLESLGLSPEIREAFRTLIQRPVGILLLTGPTGSGKSSTLCAALRTIYRPELKILTVEDPIEFTQPGIVQAEVNLTLGNTFARFLRSFLRQDPDILMVGEVRDQETAAIALRAAQTGHLLLSTLHTNNATGAVQRLLDLHDDPNGLAQALIGVMAQRLVRMVCPGCRESYQPERMVLEEWFRGRPPEIDWKRGAGCSECDNTGYRGRAALAELWVPSPLEVSLINRRAHGEDLRRAALERMTSLGEDALRRAAEGTTTLEEALRVVPYEDVVFTRERGWDRALGLGSGSGDLPLAA